ncbi:MAG: ATP-binding cassette domain-containing protein [Candidatus Gastranaerophilales bacterium]|nr:ATP-binding cassette domain-containing protein [Candidatus Gastranaerophilales bacterium]
MIEVKNICKKFDNREILKNISFKVESGETVAVVGVSGSGKSTILNIISGLLEADSGEIILGDDNLAMLFQYSALFDSLNIADNISFALDENEKFKGKYTKEQIKEIVKEKLQLVGLSGIEKNYPNELSGGMQKRVSFARGIVTNPKIILYDEPTAGLDPISSTVIEDYMQVLKRELKAASIVVTHQMSTITRTADRVIMLYNANILWQGTPEEMLKCDNPYTEQFVKSLKTGPMRTSAGI